MRTWGWIRSPRPRVGCARRGCTSLLEPLALSDTRRNGLRLPCNRGGAARCVGNLKGALQIVHEPVADNPLVLREPVPVVSVMHLAESTVQIAVHPWSRMANFNDASSSVAMTVLEGFRARGIQMPMPQRVVRMLVAG